MEHRRNFYVIGMIFTNSSRHWRSVIPNACSALAKECPNKGKPEIEIKCANCNGKLSWLLQVPRRNKIKSGKSFTAAAKHNDRTVNKPAIAGVRPEVSIE
ncbi:hypothetical protein AVEN_145915-1 [Araneus ventricosus]|uniref:Uncharacterized protein n=1 Tax=Araneus ventricosus TaxID=182803 RepID=A0A4Y2PE96_ARAVE|nr:hypothetical protein AVEN_112291-1 [Araneus ventricosus]GBN49297.1 hypothetical protein AVEN_145915-1 [Araneus ventricosus]